MLKQLNILLLCLIGLLTALPANAALSREMSETVRQARATKNKNDVTRAISYYYKMMDLYKQGQTDSSLCKAFVEGGTMLATQSRYLEAFEFYTIGVKLSNKYNDHDAYDNCMNNIANIYNEFKDRDKAIHYYRLALNSAIHDKNEEDLVGIIIYNMVTTYCLTDSAEQAKRYLRLQMLHPVNDKYVSHYYLLISQGHVAAVEKNYSGAIYYFQQGLDLVRHHFPHKAFEAEVLWNLGDTYFRMNDNKKAKEYLYQSATVGKEGNFLTELSHAYELISDVYKKEGNRDSTAKYLMLNSQIADKIYDTQQFGYKKHKLEAFEDELKNQELSKLNSTITKQMLTIIIITVLMILCIALLVVSRIRSKKLREAYRALIHNNQKLIKQYDELRQIRQEQAIETEPTDTEEPIDTGDAIDESKLMELGKKIASVMENTDYTLDPGFTLAKLATMVDSNVKYVSAAFRELYHTSFKAYLNESRIREASRRITDSKNYGNLTIAAIALSVGYKSPTSFVRSFRNILGMTPSTYKRLYEEEQTAV